MLYLIAIFSAFIAVLCWWRSGDIARLACRLKLRRGVAYIIGWCLTWTRCPNCSRWTNYIYYMRLGKIVKPVCKRCDPISSMEGM